jgi:hypothetical protein
MSYSRRYHERIAVHYSGSKTVSYPASQNGGSHTVYYDGTTYEDVNVNIDVDTNPFDRSVAGCNTSVNALTGSVVAMNTAQVASIHENSKKVAGTIVNGFFGYIRYEISQQIMELSQKLDAHLLHLRELAKTCVGKQKQMEVDYNRISSRYLKIFDDLNSELENRIFALDEPAFKFRRNAEEHSDRTSDNDLVGTVAVFGREGGELQAKISASVTKKRALNAINQANIFLWKQKKLQFTINQSMLKESVAATQFSPVCFVETIGEQNQIGKNVYQADFLPKINQNEMVENFKSQSWNNGTKEQKDNIQRYFNSEVSNTYNTANQHDERVKNMLVKIFNVNSIKFV